MNWRQFKQKALNLKHSFSDSPIKRRDEMRKLEIAYFKGINDPIEIKLRREQLRIINFNSANPHAFVPDEELFKEAEKLNKTEIENILRVEKEKQEAIQLYRSFVPTTLTTEEKLEIRKKDSIIQEKSIAFQLLKSAQTPEYVEIDMDYKTWWIVDCIGRKVISSQINNYEVRLTDKEIRDQKTRIRTNEEAFKLVKKFHKANIILFGQCYYYKRKNTYLQLGEMRHIVGNIKFLKTGKLSTRGLKPEHYYILDFDTEVGKAFINNIRDGLISLLPEKKHDKMKSGSQLISRATTSVGDKKEPLIRLELEELCKLARVTHKNITSRQKIIESYLKELKENGFIIFWTKRKKHLGNRRYEIWYTIKKALKLPIN